MITITPRSIIDSTTSAYGTIDEYVVLDVFVGQQTCQVVAAWLHYTPTGSFYGARINQTTAYSDGYVATDEQPRLSVEAVRTLADLTQGLDG